MFLYFQEPKKKHPLHCNCNDFLAISCIYAMALPHFETFSGSIE